jgi:Zn-finger in ubiquitin-hydrolases and other protein
VTPSALGCEECLRIGSEWVHLRLCRTCGHVGCCDSSPHRHATKHFHKTHHPIIEGYDPPEGWGWCYIDEIVLDLGETRRRMMDPFRVTTDAPFARRMSRRSSKPAAAAAARWCDEAIDIRKSRRATQALRIFVQSRLAADERGNRSK